MKKLIILLLLIPVMSFAQNRALRIDSLEVNDKNVTGFFNDVMSAYSDSTLFLDSLLVTAESPTQSGGRTGADSSIWMVVDDGDGKLYGKAADGDSIVVTCTDDTAYVRSNNPFYLRTGNPNVLYARKFTIDTDDLNDDDTSEDEALFTIPAGGMVQDVYCYVTTQFTGGTVSAATVAVGDTDADGLAEEHDIYGCGNTTWILEDQDGTDKGDYLFSTYRQNKIYTSATAINAQFVTTDGNLSALTAGSIDIYIVYLVATY